jgi:predicted ribosomally synthesized peptide with SipW-like signal peptide
MSDDNNGKFNLSRRKALAGIGAAGAAVGLGGIGTVAQLSDTEDRAVTFTAGGLDGTLEWSGSYNGTTVDDTDDGEFSSAINVEPDLEASGYNDRAVPIDVHFDDVKPGDYGCVNFTLEVQDNEAWVASGINVVDNYDYKNFEPEVRADDDLDESDVNVDPETGDLTSQGAATTVDGEGELAQNIYALPYYDNDANCSFFDANGFSGQYSGAAPTGFWSNAQTGDGEFDGQGNFSAPALPGDLDGIDENEEYVLAPRNLKDISENLNAIGTALWNDGSNMSIGYQTASGGHASLAKGSVMLDGSVPANGDSGNNSQSVSPLPPGTTLNFGYDFHIPFGVGNEIQGDRCSVKLDFQFIQSRHTEAPDFTSYNPENDS